MFVSLKQWLIGMISMTVLYLLQIVFFPLVFPIYYPYSNESICIFVSSLLLVVLICNLAFEVKIIHWIASDIIYLLFVWIYPAYGAYGIGLNGITLDGLYRRFDRSSLIVGVILCGVVVAFLQALMCLVGFAFKRTKHKNKCEV